MNRILTAKIICLILAVVTMLASGLLSVACGPAPATTPATKPPAATTPATVPATSAPAPTAATPAAGQPKSGGTLKFWLAGTPGGFDPHRRAPYAPIITIPIFNNLVRLDPTKAQPILTNIIPDLATKWEWSADGKTVTFTLQKGVTWHDGKPFTADDVVYSIQKMIDPTRSGIAGNFPTYEGIVQLDESTVRITLKSPSPSFLLQLAHGYCPIEPKHKATVDWRTTDFLVGTGPFKFGKATSGVSYEMVKNPNYFRKDAAGKQLPYLDGVIVNIIVDRNASASAVAAGRLDMSSPITGVANLEAYNTLKDLNKNLVFQTTTGSTGPGYFFNCETPGPFTDARVRKAFLLLIDGKDQVQATYGSTLFMDPTGGIMPPNYALPKDEIAKLLGRDIPYEQRVTQAKKLMADAGFEKGFKITIVTRPLPESLRTAQLMADLFKRYLNVDMEIVGKDAAQFNATRDAKQYSIVGDQPVSMLGEPNDLMPLFLGGSPANFMGYKNAEADKLWIQQSTELDMTKRKAITQQIERILLNDAVFAPQALFNNMTVLQPYVKGFVANEGAYCANIAWEIVWLDK